MKKIWLWAAGITLGAVLMGMMLHWGKSVRQPEGVPRDIHANSSPAPISSDTPKAPPLATPQPSTDAVPAVRDQADRDLAVALAMKTNNQWIEAREALRKFLTSYPKSERLQEAQDMLGSVHMTILLSKMAAPEKIEHIVAPGDTLAKIAAKYNVPITLIKKSNELTRDIVREGDRLWLYPAQFSILVEKSKTSLTLLDKEQFFKRYSVGLGAANRTPTGEFTITERIAEPTWWREDGKIIAYGDPENILGTHWLSLNIPHYGIHGTWEPETVGKQTSRGCIRLLNSDIEELYTILPRGTSVHIMN